MDEIIDNVGGLSLNAKEWRPGQGFATTPKASSSVIVPGPAVLPRARSAGSAERLTSATSGGSINNAARGDPSSHAIDVNGTHYFGNVASASWETSRQQHLTSAAQSRLAHYGQYPNSSTFPSHNNHQRHGPPHRSTLISALSLPVAEYHHYRELSLTSTCEMDPNDPRHKAVPPSFCRAYCLDNRHGDDGGGGGNNIITQQRSSFGYPTSVFRVTSTADGNLYCLRRVDSVRCVSHKIAQTVMHQWLSSASGRDGRAMAGLAGGGFDHPGVVRWYKCFLSQRAVFFVHQYYPGAATLKERFFGGELGQGVPLPESLVWSCLVQLVSAVRAVHGSRLAVRTLQLNHILCTQENVMSAALSGPYGLPRLRLRINCIGVVDVLEFEARKGLHELQIADMRALGCLLLSMTTGHEINASDVYRAGTSALLQEQALAAPLDFVQKNYSRELYVLIHQLLNPNAPPIGVRGIVAGMAMRAFDELDGAHGSIDEQSSALMGIYESGRALRLLLKLAFVNERPEFGIDKSWSESGDCYILKLFRDFVFHQADGAGRPVMDLGHVVSSLNKLDAADEEKIVLASRDGKNILVVSYADVAWCLEKAYQELCSGSVAIPAIA